MQSEFQYRCSVSCSRKPTNQTKKKEKTQCRRHELHLEPHNYPFLPWQNLLRFNFLWSSFRHIWWRASKAQHYRRKNGAFKVFIDFKDLSLVEHRLCGLIGSFPQESLEKSTVFGLTPDTMCEPCKDFKAFALWRNLLRFSKHKEVLVHTYAPFPQKHSPVVKLKNGQPIY